MEEFDINYKEKKEKEIENDTEKGNIEIPVIEDHIKEDFMNAKYIQREIVSKLEKWQKNEKRKCLQKWEFLENERKRSLEEEWKENESKRVEMYAKKNRLLSKMENKMKSILFNLENEERNMRLNKSQIERRREEIEQSLKLKKIEIAQSLKRMRNENKLEVEGLKRAMEMQMREYSLLCKKYENEQKVSEQLRVSLIKTRKAAEDSIVGRLKIENERMEDKISDLKKQMMNERERNSEKEREMKLQLISSLKEISRLEREMKEKERIEIDRERKSLQKMRVEIMAKEQCKSLRNERTELQLIKESLRKIMNKKSQQNS